MVNLYLGHSSYKYPYTHPHNSPSPVARMVPWNESELEALRVLGFLDINAEIVFKALANGDGCFYRVASVFHLSQELMMVIELRVLASLATRLNRKPKSGVLLNCDLLEAGG